MVSKELLGLLEEGYYTEVEMIYLYRDQISRSEDVRINMILTEILEQEAMHARVMKEIIEFVTGVPFVPSKKPEQSADEGFLSDKRALEMVLRQDLSVERGADLLYVRLVDEQIGHLLDSKPKLREGLKLVLEQTKEHEAKLEKLLALV